jgi:hypothetical protein
MPTTVFNANNIYNAEPLATGVIFVSPVGTPLPIDAQTPVLTVSSLWVDLGYTGVDGFVEKNDRRIDLKRAFGGKVVKVLQTEYNATLDFTFMESLNAFVLQAVFGSTNVVITAATNLHGNQVQVFKNSRKLPHQAWVIDTYDDALGSPSLINPLQAKYRNVVPNGVITTVAEIKVVHTDVIEYKVTLECLESPAGMDNIVTYTDDGMHLGS